MRRTTCTSSSSSSLLTRYILDVGDNDVRTEGMSYGMMVAVQRDNRTAFDALWKWATTHMRHNDPADER